MWPCGTGKPGRRSWPTIDPAGTVPRSARVARAPPGPIVSRSSVHASAMARAFANASVCRPTEALAQDRLVLQPVLAVRLEPIPRLVERQAEIDAAQHVVQTSTFRSRVVDVVRDHRAETLLGGELRERVAQRGVVGVEVVGELDVAALPEDPREP